MYISEKDREIIKMKFGGLCAYTGTQLKGDWQVDHIEPVVRNWFSKGAVFKDRHNIENMFPSQKIINHYKGSMDLETFRTWYLGGLHERLKKLPKNPKTPKSHKKKAYLLEVAELFEISETNPFSGKFYFEKIN